MAFLKKLWDRRWWLRSLPYSIWFNFHYFPFKQAWKLPIMLYKPRLLKCEGSIEIRSDKIKTGMIALGKNIVSLYPNSGVTIEIKGGGRMIFEGKCSVGNNSAISVANKGCLKFGEDFSSSTSLKIACYHSMEFGDHVRVGWDCLFMDTDFHKMTKVAGGYSKGYGPIKIGKNNWIATKCHVMKHTSTPDYCIVSACTKLSGKVDAPEYSIVGNETSVKVLRTGIWRNVDDQDIEYP